MAFNTSSPAILDPLLEDNNQQEDEVKEEQTSTSKKKRNMEPKGTRQRNYSNCEDLQLCAIWLDITQDPIIGKNQTGDKFWNRITKKYMLAIPDPLRTPMGLKSCWCALQATITKFSACVKQIEHRNQRGATNEDKLTYALCLYAETHKKAFAHIACYNILVNAPKWNEYIASLQMKSSSQKRKRQDSVSNDLPGSVANTSIADSSEPPSDAFSSNENLSGQLKRPSGHKKAKADQQQTDVWQRSLAKSQQEMVEQTKLQNKLLAAQTKSMNSIAEDSQSMVKDSFMSKTYSHLDERTQSCSFKLT
ncbi:hypothetical protein PCASD_22543 [Puccinia coronata f. sp. avenae]|uniref:No apical meristem-associated C-terminal domain-containing protein n=1 Tax=Puccinia coronata f. sp. avenae TaxID=200324 RepID=A0A2N5SBC5_9BASI|nr:hypothetical protein PCASD_22543 [Puccinia coronata f. sp. avenae]